MRIGELLVEQRKLRQSDLARALAERPADTRLCSYLVARGLVDFDDASRALGEQKGVACALAKHLAGRDPDIAKLIPAELGRASCALPIGRTSKGAVIVCVRDPASSVLAALRQATRAEIMMVIAPAHRLEQLVLSAYGAAPSDELDIDFGMGDSPAPARQAPARQAPASPPAPRRPSAPPVDPDEGGLHLSLAELEDVDVSKALAEAVEAVAAPPARTPAPAPVPAPAPPVVPATPAVATPRVRARTSSDPKATRPMSIAAMSVGLEHATTREAATDLVLAYVATRWRSGVVFAIRDKSANGYRGHGVSMPELVSIPLGVPSTLQRAVEAKAASAEAPASLAQDALVRALDGPASTAAAPVLVGGQAVAVIVVGDPIEADTPVDEAVADLGMLAEALGNAYQRIMAR